MSLLAVLHGFDVLLPLGYLIAGLAYLAVYRTGSPASARLAPRLIRALVALHAAALVVGGFALGHVPVLNVWEALSFVAFALAAVYVVLEWRLQNLATGVFVLVPAFVFQVLASFAAAPPRPVSGILRSPWFGGHVATALLGYAAYAIAAVYGLLYLLLYVSLKGSRVGLVFQRLPSLEVLARLTWHALVFGWVSLTLAIGVGTIWVTGLQASGQVGGSFVTDPKVLVTIVIWAVYTGCLAGRLVFAWSGRRLAAVSVVAFLLLVLSSAAVNLFLTSFHDFG